MNASLPDGTGDPVLEAYISALRESFGTEPWDDIETFARRVWLECRFDGDPDWEAIRHRVQVEWSAGD